jgi:glycosyltransferase involved in cell wall biosynthesis
MKRIILLLLCITASAFAKIRILTFHYNEPEFIELQFLSFKQFMRDDFELIVFNDGNTPEREEGVRKMCEKHGIQCVRYEPEWHIAEPYNEQLKEWANQFPSWIPFKTHPVTIEHIAKDPSIRHCHVIQHALNLFGYNHDDIVVILDGDVFAVRPLSLRELMKGNDIIGSYRVTDSGSYQMGHGHTEYLWVTFIAFNPVNLPDKADFHFFPDLINGKMQDSGSHLYHYVNNHPEVSVKKYPVYWHWGKKGSRESWNTEGLNGWEKHFLATLDKDLSVQFQLENRLLHFGESSFLQDGHDRKKARIAYFIRWLVRTGKGR